MLRTTQLREKLFAESTASMMTRKADEDELVGTHFAAHAFRFLHTGSRQLWAAQSQGASMSWRGQ